MVAALLLAGSAVELLANGGGTPPVCTSQDAANSPGCYKTRDDDELEALLGGPGNLFDYPVVCGQTVTTPSEARSVMRGGSSPCVRLKRDLLVTIFNIRRSVLFGDGKLGDDGVACMGIDSFRKVLRCGDIFVPDESTPDPSDAVVITEKTPLSLFVEYADELCMLAECPDEDWAPCGKTLDALAWILNAFNSIGTRHGECSLCKGDTEPPVLTCPDELVKIECQGPDGTPIDYEVGIEDNCDPNPDLVCFPPPGTLLPLGQTTEILCRARDLHSFNTSKCHFWVEVVDTRPPAINCPGEPIVVDCVAGEAGTVVAYPEPTASDICDDDVEVVCDPPSGSVFPFGSTTVTCTATDGSGNVATCSFDVVVVDNTEVELICSADVVVECTDPAGAVVEYPAPVVSATCSTPPAPVCEPPSGSVFPLGETLVACTTSGPDGEPVSCSFTVNVVATQPPVIVCPQDLTLECSSPDGTPVSYEVGAVDICDPAPVVVCDPPAGSPFPVGSTEVWCTATDMAGNVSRCSFVVTVIDTTPPAIACPEGPVRVDCSVLEPFPGAVVNYTAPQAEDVCDAGVTIVCEPPSGTLFPLGATEVTCIATDASGNSSSCTFTVEVVDSAPPQLVCVEDIVIGCDGADGSIVDYAPPTVADDCDEFPTLVCDPPSGSLFPLGDTTVTCVASDASGNEVSCAFVVTVEDATPPVVMCPADIIVECTSPAGSRVEYTANATDTCDPSPALACDPPSGSMFPLGATVVTCVASDMHGNRSTCEFTVNVVDTTPPVLRCPETVVAECSSSEGTPVAFLVTAEDACADVVTVTCNPPSGATFPFGTTLVACTARDAAGNTNACSFEVTVVDTAGPSIDCPVDAVVVECDDELSGAVRYPLPSINDACDSSPTIVCEPPPGTTLPLGTHTITCTATDALGNSSTCEFDVTVVDTAPPELVCSSDIVRECTGPDGAVVTYELPTANDTCDPAPNLSCLPPSGSVFPIGRTVVTCTADDQFGNLMKCEFVVEVVDTTPPMIQCPADIGALCASAKGTPVSFDVTATDVCDPNPIITCEPPSGALFPLGTTVVTCTAVDRAGNMSVCEFAVTVRDETPPQFTCPEDFEVECLDGVAVVEYPLPEVFDGCDPSPVVVCDPPSGSQLEPGAHVVTCTATDASGNETACQFTVTVIDTVPPELVCPPDMSVECQSPGGTVVDYSLPVVTDECDGDPVIACVPPPGSLFPLGSTEVTCVASDRSGNEIRCSFVLTVVDTTPPELLCPKPIVSDCASPDGAEVTFETTASDLCDPAPTLVCEPPSGSLFPIGKTMVTCRSSDAEGNETECAFLVTVVDRTPPSLTCPGDLELLCTTNGEAPHKPPGWPPGHQPEPNSCTAVLEYTVPDASDLCQEEGVQVTCTPPSGTKLEMGTHTITCRARDLAGNEAVCTFTVDVLLGLRAFIRGDANSDAQCDIGDPIWIINHLFLGNPAPACLDSADCNDDGEMNLADALYDLNFIFRGSARPPDPYLPLCGLDPTDGDLLDCASFLPCE